MTLATRCPACGTAFRVVQDQLRVSQGWVRCGRCSEAFNAVDSMVDVPTVLTAEPEQGGALPARDFSAPAVMDGPREAAAIASTVVQAAGALSESAPAAPELTPSIDPGPAPTPPDPSPVPSPSITDLVPAPATPSIIDETPVAAQVDKPDGGVTFVLEQPRDAAATETSDDASTHLLDLPMGLHLIASDGAISEIAGTTISDEIRSDTPGNAPVPAPVPAPVEAPEEAAADLTISSARAASADEILLLPAQASPAFDFDRQAAQQDGLNAPADMVGEAPSFVVKADRAARWRRPGVRAILSLLVAAGLVGLVAQMSFTFRDRLVATLPAARPVMLRACEAIGCRIEDFRQIEALSVESSTLARVEGSSVYRLAVLLRNRAEYEVAAPALDLALTDSQGQPLAKRVLSMRDLYLPLRTLSGGSELPIQVPLSIGDRQVSGYTVEIFYP